MSVSTAPASLSAKMFLLACDLDRKRVAQCGDLGYLLRATMLAELSQAGLVSERDGKVRASSSQRARDPLLTALLREIEEGRPRGWRGLVNHRARATVRAVRERLARAGVITVSTNRVLGVLPVRTVTVAEPALVTGLRERLRAELAEDTPVDHLDRTDATLLALASAGGLRVAVGWRDRWRHKNRLDECAAYAGVVPLRKALAQLKAARGATHSG